MPDTDTRAFAPHELSAVSVDWFAYGRERLCVQVVDYEGRRRADIRVWAERPSGWIATKRGLQVDVEHLPRLAVAVEALARAVAQLPDEEEENRNDGSE